VDERCSHLGQQSLGGGKVGVKMNILGENFYFLCSFELFNQIKRNSRNDWVCFKV